MKTMLSLLAAAALATSAGAVTVTSVAGAPDPGPTALQTILFDFESATPQLTGSYTLATGSVGGQYAAPALDTTQYAVVPMAGAGGGTATLDLTGLANPLKSFSFYWGSIDGYNTLELLNGNTVFATILGSDLPPANGDQGAAITNRRVNFMLAPGEVVTSVRFTSTQAAFEFDDFAGAVPEPANWAMLIMGFGLIGGAARLRRNNAGVVA